MLDKVAQNLYPKTQEAGRWQVTDQLGPLECIPCQPELLVSSCLTKSNKINTRSMKGADIDQPVYSHNAISDNHSCAPVEFSNLKSLHYIEL